VPGCGEWRFRKGNPPAAGGAGDAAAGRLRKQK